MEVQGAAAGVRKAPSMKLGKLGVGLVLVATPWLWSAAWGLSSAGQETRPCAAIDDPEPISCPLCGGDAALHFSIIRALANEAGRQGVNVLRVVFG